MDALFQSRKRIKQQIHGAEKGRDRFFANFPIAYVAFAIIVLIFADFGHYIVGNVEVGGDVLHIVVVVEPFHEF
jgi:hypothetical protein